jgi:hypothetical protein
MANISSGALAQGGGSRRPGEVHGHAKRRDEGRFSGSGSSYVIGKAVNTTDEDWGF